MNEKERPMLFSAPMVRALLDGRKTMTRRVIKPQPRLPPDIDPSMVGPAWDAGFVDVACPYGQPGERLWVRERMRVVDLVNHGSKVAAIRVGYEADNAERDFIEYPERLDGTPVVGRCLAYGGFREASRILLEITNVRVERVQEINEIDSWNEGIGPEHGSGETFCKHPIAAFRELWDSINAARGFGWDVNPWVWVIEFKSIVP
jgi:hypothetical protein